MGALGRPRHSLSTRFRLRARSATGSCTPSWRSGDQIVAPGRTAAGCSQGAPVAPPAWMWTLASIVVAIVVAIALLCAGRPWWAWLLGGIPLLARWSAAGGGWGLAIAVAVWLCGAVPRRCARAGRGGWGGSSRRGAGFWLGVALVAGVPSIRRHVLGAPV